jgi:lipid-A-disaccharide synthase
MEGFHLAEPHLYLVAAEPSGDALGADLIFALKARKPDCQISGIGGEAMAAAGIASAMSIEGLSILGFTDALAAWKRVEEKADEAAAAILSARPDVVILIDSWGFTLRVARRVRAKAPEIALIKLVGPQVWATRPGRAKVIANAYDGLLCIHDFEVPFYDGTGLPIQVVGNPAMGRNVDGDGSAFRTRHGLGERPILLMLPGSRSSEMARVMPVLVRTCERLVREVPDLMIVTVLAGPVARTVQDAARSWPFAHTLVGADEKTDAFAAATVALACSGTVTTEVALAGVPMVVGYKAGWVTWAIARAFLMKSKFINLLNVAAGREIVPEFVQTRFTPEHMLQPCLRLLGDSRAASDQVAQQNLALDRMGRGGPGAATLAADAILGAFWMVRGT